MRTDSENHIRIDFGVIDLGVHAAVGDRTLWVYTVLRRYIWRSKKSGPLPLRQAYAEGRLVAKVSQGSIAKHLGIGRDTVNRAIGILEEMAWIEKAHGAHEGNDEVLYVLGEVVDQKGGYNEVYTADSLCWGLMQQMQELAEKRKLETIHQIPIDDRIELTKEYFGRFKGKPLTRGLSEKPTRVVGKSDKGCLENRQGLSDFPTHNRELEIENSHREPGIHDPTGRGAPAGSEGSDGEAQAHSPPPGRTTELDQKPAAVTRCVNGDEGGAADHVVPPKVPMDAKSVQERRRAALEKAEAAKLGFKAARTAKDRKRSERDQKVRNLGGEGARKDPAVKKQISRLEGVWKKHFERQFPDVPLAKWEGREVGQVLSLIEKYNVGIVEDGLRYVTDNWEAISERFTKSPQTPTVGWLLAVHDSLIPEASKFGKVVGVLEEWNAWWDQHPDESPPPPLKRRFEENRKELESLGLI